MGGVEGAGGEKCVVLVLLDIATPVYEQDK